MIKIAELSFQYGRGEFRLHVPELHIERGRRVALVGPSGCGKTTLVNLIAGIFKPAAGRVSVAGEDLTRFSDAQRRRFRIARIGFVFQEFELVEYLSVLDNILLPFLINPAMTLTRAVRDAATRLARDMGLAKKVHRKPRALSQGERQRVAICRALIAEPPLILADEPTGNLDPATAAQILDLLFEAVTSRDATLLMVTHNHALLDRFDSVVDVNAFCGEPA